MKENRKQKLSGIMVLILVVAMLMGGTLAWQDISQHKTNTFRTTSVQHNVVLVEDFKPVINWKINQVKDSNVSVRNGQETDNVIDFDYDDAYVRVQFKEFMSIQKLEYKDYPDRLMIDKKGDYITGDTEAELKLNLEAAGVVEVDMSRMVEYPHYLESYTGNLWYYKTAADDINGQYGKFLVEKEENIGNAKSLVPGVVDASKDADPKHQDHVNGEDNYTVHKWEKGRDDFAEASSPFNEYIEWDLGSDIIAIEDWDGRAVDKWILDTDSDEGWAYWGRPLVHDTESVVYASSTSDILKNVELIANPDGKANYYIHANLNAVSISDLGLWQDAPSSITNAHQGKDRYSLAKDALAASIDIAERIDLTNPLTTSAQNLVTELESAKAVYAVNTKIQAEIDQAKVDLDATLEAYNADPLNQLKKDLAVSLKKGQDADTTGKTNTSKGALDTALSNGDSVLNKSNATEQEVRDALEAIEDAINRLLDFIPKAGDKLKFAERGWTLVGEHEGMSLVLADPLTEEEMNAMGISNTTGYVPYLKSGSTYVPYSQSRVKEVDEAFYNTYIATRSEVVSSVKAVSFEDETGRTGWNTRKDHPTKMDAKGTKKAFSLSVSDINEYNIVQGNNLFSTYHYWTRSPGEISSEAANMSFTGRLTSNRSVLSVAIRPALWVDLSTLDFTE